MSEDQQKQASAPAPSGAPRREGGPGAGRREGGPAGGGPGGPGGRPRGKRQYFRKKKVCKFCVGHFVPVRAGAGQDPAPPHDRGLRAAPAGVGRGHQARAQYCVTALFGQRRGRSGPPRGNPGGATRRACAGRDACGTGRGSTQNVTSHLFSVAAKNKRSFEMFLEIDSTLNLQRKTWNGSRRSLGKQDANHPSGRHR